VLSLMIKYAPTPITAAIRTTNRIMTGVFLFLAFEVDVELAIVYSF